MIPVETYQDCIEYYTICEENIQNKKTENQAKAILEMRLYKLIGLEIEALMKEHNETLEKIALYEDLLSHRSSMAKMIIKELTEFKKSYGRPRRTVVDNLAEAVVEEKPIEEKDVVFLMDRFGYAKTIDVSIYERNKETADSENRYAFVCKNTDKICIFTNMGQLHTIKVLDLPAGRLKDKGTPIDNLSNYDSKNESYIYISSLQNIASGKVVFGTKQSMIKLVDGSEFVVAKKTTAATKLADGDELITVRPLKGNETMVMRSEKEVFLRIECATIPEKKKSAVGVRGMKLDKNDLLKDIYVLGDGENETIEVKGKELALNRLHIGNRDTKGVKR